MMNTLSTFAVTGLAFFGLSSHAATISYVDAELDYGTKDTWNTATIAQDIGTDNLAGSDGWYVRTSEAGNSTPYLTSAHVSPNRNATYHDVGNDSSRAESAPLLRFVIDNNDLVGKTLRVGVLFDVYSGNGNIWTYTVKQTVGGAGTATSPLLALNDPRSEFPSLEGSKLDIAHFDITGAVAGDTFVITATPGVVPVWPGPFEPVFGMTFDSAVVPEPGSLALIAIGGLAMMRRRR